jgi:NAD(P)-dependent dehydrogenase (short-subunit alcohol dehydrogenase family)
MGAFSGKVAWMTGGGTGIGLAAAVELARRGARVAVSGRREDRLAAAVEAIAEAGGQGMAVACDVTDEASTAAAVARIVEAWGQLDVVLANAGFAVAGKVETLTDAEWRRQFDTNVFGLLNTVRAALPELRKTGGRVGLVGSVAAFVSAPKNGAYNASKAAVRAIAETLSAELEGTGVSCSGIHPGFVESEIALVTNEGTFDPERKDKRPRQLMWRADHAAVEMIDGLERRRREVIVTRHGRMIALLSRWFPSVVARLATRV